MNNPLVFDVASTGLEPLHDRIIGITCKALHEERIFTSPDEKIILEEFFAYVSSNNFDAFVGYNNLHFDIPMIRVRCLKHRVVVPDLVTQAVDLRRILFDREKIKGKLSEFGEFLGLKFPEVDFTKRNISLLWENHRSKELRSFLLQDVKITWELFINAREVGIL